MDLSLLTSVTTMVTALGIGTIAGQWIASGRDRREARARALHALEQVEQARWGREDAPTFQVAMRELAVAALTAQVPRRQLQLYRVLATAAYWENDLSLERTGGEWGGIGASFGELVSDAARLLADTVWAHGPLRRIPLLVRARRIETRVRRIEDESRRIRIENARRSTWL